MYIDSRKCNDNLYYHRYGPSADLAFYSTLLVLLLLNWGVDEWPDVPAYCMT
jgi:hypothetical protein